MNKTKHPKRNNATSQNPTASPLGGPAQSFPPDFFWREAKFFEALGRTKKQTDAEQREADFLTQ